MVSDDVTKWIDEKKIERKMAYVVLAAVKKTGRGGTNYARRQHRKKKERAGVT